MGEEGRAISDDPIKSNGSKIEGIFGEKSPRHLLSPKTDVPPSTPFRFSPFSLNSTRHDCDRIVERRN